MYQLFRAAFQDQLTFGLEIPRNNLFQRITVVPSLQLPSLDAEYIADRNYGITQEAHRGGFVATQLHWNSFYVQFVPYGNVDKFNIESETLNATKAK